MVFWYGTRNPCEVVRDRAGFSRKKFFAPNIGKMLFRFTEKIVINFY